ncbi:DUF1236 domain-containing protein [Pseudotabrizicola sediminis]|uniref:DUF1236 domain-containing protein n=1 Tax=Pseudotabrizicola sediminis TaxID=2486418 RepID=A0ABY2KJS3_9RHOB|nr:DUF1236 domain-containing protein [Pseudotabrizicola sediminis]TGD42661.1 DUF1236 domain-containing protein [Pseudotabrizicola sediminis]TGD63644.1 DUF1236 domain-containing protein [Tabrizicola sp. WMC-M-20]
MFTKSLLIATAATLFSTSAYAATEATAWTDLNLRAGPGPVHQIIGVIPANGVVAVDGCLDSANWCKVSFEGTEGWASGDYLTAMVDNTPVVVYTNREQVAVGTVTYEDNSAEGAAVGGATGAIAGAMVAGPVGALVGVMLGGGLGAAAAPDTTVTTYVTGNPVEPIYLEGEVVVGAGIPETVTLVEVPDSEYSYAYVNGVPVIVEREKRQIVYIVR